MVEEADKSYGSPSDCVMLPLLTIIWLLELPSWKPMVAFDMRSMFELLKTLRLAFHGVAAWLVISNT
jgi:hypothetical protein